MNVLVLNFNLRDLTKSVDFNETRHEERKSIKYLYRFEEIRWNFTLVL